MNLANSIVEWDSNNKKQINEAKILYINARKENRRIEKLDGSLIEHFSPDLEAFRICEPELKENEIMVRLVNETGDERLIWDTNDPKQIKEAAQRFQDYLNKGWKAYAIDTKGNKNQRIFAFNPDLEELILDDKNNIKEKLKNFAKRFHKIEVLPRTFPG